jgi:hypothetical protein
MRLIDIIYANPVYAFIAGIVAGAITWSLISSYIRNKIIISSRRSGIGGWFASLLEKWIAKIFYDQKSNAFVAENITESRSFLDITFPPYKNVDGEIWLYQADMLAFSDRGDFETLYENKVLVDDGIKAVKAVISPRSNPTEKSDIPKSKVLNRWQEIQKNINSAKSKDLNVSKIKVCPFTELVKSKELSERFHKFVDDETWVFYVRYNKDGGVTLVPPSLKVSREPNVCIHRRFVDPTLKEQQMDDERVVVTGTYPVHDSSMDNLLPGDIQSNFRNIFRDQRVWVPIDDFITEHIINGEK